MGARTPSVCFHEVHADSMYPFHVCCLLLCTFDMLTQFEHLRCVWGELELRLSQLTDTCLASDISAAF